MKLSLSLLPLILAGLVLAIGLDTADRAFAKGKIKTTRYSKIKAGQDGNFTAVAECEDNTPTGVITLVITVKDSNGATVAQSASVGSGNQLSAAVTLPGGLLQEDNELSATVELDQASGENDDTTAQGTPAG